MQFQNQYKLNFCTVISFVRFLQITWQWTFGQVLALKELKDHKVRACLHRRINKSGRKTKSSKIWREGLGIGSYVHACVLGICDYVFLSLPLSSVSWFVKGSGKDRTGTGMSMKVGLVSSIFSSTSVCEVGRKTFTTRWQSRALGKQHIMLLGSTMPGDTAIYRFHRQECPIRLGKFSRMRNHSISKSATAELGRARARLACSSINTCAVGPRPRPDLSSQRCTCCKLRLKLLLVDQLAKKTWKLIVEFLTTKRLVSKNGHSLVEPPSRVFCTVSVSACLFVGERFFQKVYGRPLPSTSPFAW